MAIKLKCIDETLDGKGIILYKEKKYEINNLLKDEEASFTINSYGRPILEKIITSSPRRQKTNCSAYMSCGGCQYLNISYEEELKKKQQYFDELFKSFSGIKTRPIVGMYEYLNYRNKCQMVYKLSKARKVSCGFYEENTHNIIPVLDCKLHATAANKVIEALNLVFTKNKIMPYDERTKTGIIRHVLVRYGFNTKELMLVIVTNGEMFPGRNNVIKDLLKQNLPITTIIQNFNARDTSIVLGDKEKVLYGPGFINDKIGPYTFKISARSFYQINTLGMKKLYDRAIELANINNNDIVLDTYCGVGTIGIFASKNAKTVYGVELNKDAYKDAIVNAKINKIKNIEFINDDATHFVQMLAKNKEKIDVLIMDPPRSGSTEQFIQAISYLKPRRVVYVSCEPKTLKRDLYEFSDIGYKLESVEGFDMFPRTFNIESIALLTINEDDSNFKESLEKSKKIVQNNKMRVIPKADIEMMREDQYERTGNLKQKKYKTY